jgi:hypothetical protein
MDKNKEKRIATIGDLLGGTTALLKSTLSTDVLGDIVGSIDSKAIGDVLGATVNALAQNADKYSHGIDESRI